MYDSKAIRHTIIDLVVFACILNDTVCLYTINRYFSICRNICNVSLWCAKPVYSPRSVIKLQTSTEAQLQS